MADCNPTQLQFSSCRSRKVQADFNGGNVTSDGGLLLLREVDRKLNLLSRAAKLFKDDRDPNKVIHTQESQLKQRVFALAQGHEDLNDHDQLRHDILLQTAAEKTSPLASAPTLCRMEQRADRRSAMNLTHLLMELFIESHKKPPSELILDFGATDDLIHGRQQGSAYNHYYRGYYFLHIYVFCGSHPLCALLRPSNTDGARGAWAVLKILVKKLREAWPEVRIIFRADSGFCRWRMLRWWPNQHRLIMSTLAYILIDGLRRLGLEGSDWASKQCGTIRTQLRKIGAVVVGNTRRIKVHLSSVHPARKIFESVHRRLGHAS